MNFEEKLIEFITSIVGKFKDFKYSSAFFELADLALTTIGNKNVFFECIFLQNFRK